MTHPTAKITGPVGDQSIIDQLGSAAGRGASAYISPEAVDALEGELRKWLSVIEQQNTTIERQNVALGYARDRMSECTSVLGVAAETGKIIDRSNRILRVAFWLMFAVAIIGWLA